MDGNKQIVALQEKDILLVVTQETIGQLTTNIKEIKTNVKRALPMYDISNYSADDIPKCKADKALLNKAAKALDDKRKELEKAWNKPFEEFKATSNETVKLIKDAVTLIDGVVKSDEERIKNEKRAEIEKLAKDMVLDDIGVKLELIFDKKWLNKTTSMKTVEKDINAKLDTIKKDLDALRTFPEDYDVLAARYLENLNLQETIAYANSLKEQREKKLNDTQTTQSAIVAPKEPSAPVFVQQTSVDGKETASKIADEEADAADAFAAAMGQSVAPPIQTNVRTYLITGTDEMFEQLEAFMNGNGIKFKLG